jgi:methyl-accepting chemotaxis protein
VEKNVVNKWVSHIKIKHKLLLIMAMLGASLFILGLAFYYTQLLHHETQMTSEQFGQIDTAIHSIEFEVVQARRAEQGFLQQKELSFKQQHSTILTTLFGELSALESLLKDRADSGAVSAVREQLQQYAQAFELVAKIIQANGLDHNTGLQGALRHSVHRAEKLLNEQQALALAHSMLMMRRHEKDYLARRLPKYVKKLQLQQQRFISLLPASNLPQGVQLKLRLLIIDYKDTFLALVTGFDRRESQTAQFQQIINQLPAALGTLKQNFAKLGIQAREESAETQAFIGWLYWLLLASLAVFSALVMRLVINSINHSTSHLTVMLRQIATGDAVLSNRIELNGKDEMAEIAKWFNRFMDKLQDMLGQSTLLSQQLAQVSEQAHQSSDQTTRAIGKQVREMGEITDLTHEMSTAIFTVASNAKVASEQANDARQTTQAGTNSVADVIKAIQCQAEFVEQTAESVQRLDKYSHNIDSVVGIIDGIAEQTNLLALNAAIEAARAGSAGRGFAVVADEVRTLSQRTTSSIEEIKKTINELQQGTRQTVEVMQQSKKQSASSVAQARRAGDSLTDIALSISSIAELNAQIALSSSKQSDIADQINRNIGEINVATNRLAESARQTVSDSSDISESSVMLLSLSERFGAVSHIPLICQTNV